MQQIILMRHVESEKNVRKAFSSNLNKEQLTNIGTQQSIKLARCVSEYAKLENLKIKHIYAASSERARLTAGTIAKQLDVDVICEDSFLSVTTDESLKGKTEDEITKINPKFIEELNLYRCGLFNAYQYSTVADVIKSGEYEDRVIKAFAHILQDTDETLKVFVMHHSSITATLIHIARVMGIYPENFYGRIEADLGKLYVINYDSRNNKYGFKIANDCPEKLLNR